MSYRHIKLKRVKADNNLMEYEILSPDFNDQMQWEDFGILELNINDGSFIHRNNELWLKNKIYPINLFALIESEREKIIKEKYVGYGIQS